MVIHNMIFYLIPMIAEFLENFELSIKNGYLEENLLKNLEANKIKIFTTLSNNGPFNRFIKTYVSKLWNLCRMLNYTRNIKDTDNNYFLLRLKDFLCDLFLLIFTSLNEVTLHDAFNLIQIVTDVGTQWMKLEIKMSTEGWVRKVDNIMKYLITKINDVENLIHLEKKFYVNFMEYVTFYLENFISISKTSNSTQNNNNLTSSSLTYRHEEILKIIILVKNIKFIENENSTRNLFSSLINVYKNYYSETNNIENILYLCEGFETIKYKNLLSSEIISEFYKFYIQILINNNSMETAEAILKNLFQFIPPNSKEEIECYLTNLEIFSNYVYIPEYVNKIKDIIEILFEHKEFNLDYLEDVFIIFSNLKLFDLVFEFFLSKLKSTKVLRLSSCNNNTVFQFETLKNYKIMCFLFIYSFFKSNFFNSFTYDTAGTYLANYVNLFEILKIFAECLLENYSNNLYEEEHAVVIPTLFKNIVILFLKVEKQNENFSSYFLLEIIKKLKDSQKEFIDLSLQIYIEKKDFLKLKNMLLELEENNSNSSNNTNSLYFYSSLIIIVKEGNKWNSYNQINSLCSKLNSSEDFHMIYYLKLFNFILENSSNDFSLISLILQNFSIKFFEIYNQGDYEKIKLEDKSKNKSMSFFDVVLEIMGFYSKLNHFPQQVIHFCDFLNIVGNCVESQNMNENSHVLTNNLIGVLEVVNILLNYKNGQGQGNFDSNNLSNNIKIRNCEEFPEFILISACKLLNFIFTNFLIFAFEFFNIDEVLIKDQMKSIIELFDLYKNLSIFYFSYEYANLNNKEEENIDIIENNPEIIQNSSYDNINSKSKLKLKFEELKKNYLQYQQTFNNATLILTDKFSNNSEFLSYINDKLKIITNSTTIVDRIIMIQIMSKIETETSFEDHIMEIATNNTENKKFILLVNSILYQNGFKNLSSKFIKKILSSILSMFQEIVPKYYSIEEIFTLFKDYINLVDNNLMKVSSMKEFSSILTKLIGKIDESMLNDNIEWILYKIFTLLENGENKINKTDKEFQIAKQIFDELNVNNVRNKSFVLNNLFDIILKKLL